MIRLWKLFSVINVIDDFNVEDDLMPIMYHLISLPTFRKLEMIILICSR